MSINNESGITPLIEAIQQNDFIKVKTVIDTGVNVNVKDNSGFSPLMVACLAEEHNENNLNIIKVLLENGANVYIRYDGVSAIDIVNPEVPRDDYNYNPWPEAYKLLKEHNYINTKNLKDDISKKISEYINKFSNTKNINNSLIQDFVIFICNNKQKDIVDYTSFSPDINKKIKSYIEVYSLLIERKFIDLDIVIKQKDDDIKRWIEKEKNKVFYDFLNTQAHIAKEDIACILGFINTNDINSLISFIIEKNFNETQISKIKDITVCFSIEKIKLVKLFTEYKFKEAKEYFIKQNEITIEEYNELNRKYLSKYLAKKQIIFNQTDEDLIIDAIVKEDVDTLLDKFAEYKIDSKKLYKIKDIFSEEILNDIHSKLDLYSLLKKEDFKQFDSLLKNISKSQIKDLLDIKAKYIKKYLESIGQKCAIEQSLAIGDTCQNVLLKARAGSGKTTTIVNKALFEIKKYNLKTDELHVLAFNKKAAENVNNKLTELNIKSDDNDKIATTFHALARKIYLRYRGLKEVKILDAQEQHSGNKKKIVIHQLLDEELKPNKTIEELYEDIRNSCFLIDKNGTQKYYGSILMEDEVELPLQQKYIADFFFEHFLEYENKPISSIHTNVFYFKNKITKQPYFADFHFRIKEKNIFIRLITNQDTSYQKEFKEYRSQKDDVLLEFECPPTIGNFSKADTQGRIAFEKELRHFLENNGFTSIHMKDKIARLTDFLKNYKNNFYEFCENIINQYQQKQWTKEEIIREIKRFEQKNDNNQYLNILKISERVYEKYIQYLKENNYEDFNTIMGQSYQNLKNINNSTALSSYQFKLKEKIKKWKLLCIDEFQDFTQLFFNLVKAIKQINPDIKLFCVGDDWQSINGFAGADRQFFQDFENKIKKEFNQEAKVLLLRTNRRSREEILEASNYFKTGNPNTPEGCIPDKSKNDDEILVNNQSFYYIKSNGENKSLLNSFNALQIDNKVSHNIFDYFCAISKVFLRDSTGKLTYFVLSRRNKIIEKLNNNYESFIDYLRYDNIININKQDFNKRVKFSTAHKSKGLEADIVIILVDHNSFPLYNPTSELMSAIFGLDWYAEESNLFYVAMTRAKYQVYFVEGSTSNTYNEFVDRVVSKYVMPYKNKLF